MGGIFGAQLKSAIAAAIANSESARSDDALIDSCVFGRRFEAGSSAYIRTNPSGRARPGSHSSSGRGGAHRAHCSPRPHSITNGCSANGYPASESHACSNTHGHTVHIKCF